MFEAKTISIVDAVRTGLKTGHSPYYVLLGDRYLRKCHEVEPGSIVEIFHLTYRLVERRPERAAGVYARPWLLWAILRLREKVRMAFWSSVGWLNRHGFIHFRTPEAQCIRWRDLGLGPDPKGA